MTLQANQAALFLEAQDTVTIRTPQVSAALGGLPTWRASLDSLDQEMGQAPRATFSIGFGRSVLFGQDMRLEHAARLVAPGQMVRARLLRGGVIPGAERGDLVLFEGRVTGIEMKLDAQGEQLMVLAEDLAADVLACRIGGQHIATAAGGAGRVSGMDLVFNPDGRPNAAAQLYATQEGTAYRIFAPESPAGAVAWTLDEAVAFLLAEFGSSDTVGIPSRGEVLSLLDATPVRDVDLEGMTLGDALQTLLDIVGGGFIVTAQPGPLGVSRRLELWVPKAASSTWLSHQVPGSLYRPSQTDFQSLALAAQFASTPQRYVARGDRKVYESTFDLVAGWDDALASYETDRYSPSTNNSFGSIRDVYRKWVLNEAGEYSASPYSRGTAPDLSAVFEGDPYVRWHRRLLPSLSYDALGRGYGVYAEISFDEGATWERLAVSAKVLENECGLYLTEDTLPPRYLRAAMRDQVRVRVTASVESDSCLTAERAATGGSALAEITRYLDVPAGYRYRKIANASRFHGQGGADEVNDGPRLQALVDAAFEADRPNPTPGRVEMPWLAMAHRVGQRVRGIRGRRLDLTRDQSGYETDPVIRRIRFRLTPTPATELELV